MIRAVSLFSNVGVAEAYLKDIGINVAVANELLEQRAKFYSNLYPSTKMICGDITNNLTYSEIIRNAKEKKVDLLMWKRSWIIRKSTRKESSLMKLSINFSVSSLLTRGGGLVNLYKIILYKEIKIIKDYEMSSYNTRVFS